ncbi:MAG TPA: MXAN_5187 C-terminal domain-containing protein [Kofleriaceae bacterium]|jgi:HAMP domain-containing protein|nr:MXAN_5187 C-terminal domain-containing protein [Kofleriaceae bacterium]
MSRTVIGAVVAVVIALLTAIAFFVTSASFDKSAKQDSKAQAVRAHDVVYKLTQLGGIDVGNKAERLAAFSEFVQAVKPTTDNVERQSLARRAFTKFTSDEKNGDVRPNLIALVNVQGEVLAMNDIDSGSIVKNQWKNEKPDPKDDTSGPTVIPALNVVLNNRRVIIGDIWIDHGKMFKIGVAPIVDPEAYNPRDPEGGAVIIGAIVVTYAETKEEAQKDRRLLGTEIAYYENKHALVSSFVRSDSSEEDTAKTAQINEVLAAGKVKEDATAPVPISVDGVDYYAAAVPIPIYRSKALPDNYPKATAAAMVLAPMTENSGAGFAARLFILLVGLGSLAIALVGIYIAHRRLIAQADQIEQGVTDIINGNLDRTISPVGAELDGLANGLNVMLARLLGRPEPGEEEFDDEGNPIVQGRVEFDEGDDRPAADPDLAALAQESEPDYYKRVFTEYQAGRRATGSPDDGSFENFIAKLKVNEGKLKAQYQCRAVRFRVVTKDGKVSLKPVPIFA